MAQIHQADVVGEEAKRLVEEQVVEVKLVADGSGVGGGKFTVEFVVDDGVRIGGKVDAVYLAGECVRAD